MNLLALRNEVLAHGFDPIQYSGRVNQYLNDALSLIARRVDYYVDEATLDFTTTTGTASYPFPGDFARMRSLRDTGRFAELTAVNLRDIDRSDVTQGAPVFYALDGANVHLYPVPDGVYSLEMRYWKMPAALVNDTDEPNLPADWHWLLWLYAVWMCYEADDDAQMGQYWQQRFTTGLSEFAASAKFPNSDMPHVASGMWEGERSLSQAGWSMFGSWGG